MTDPEDTAASDHPNRSHADAREIAEPQEPFEMLQTFQETLGRQRHRMGFGDAISLGFATVGMVGFGGWFDYTASDTAVNPAADREILPGQRAASAQEGMAGVETAGELTLKGSHAPVDVFRMTDMRDAE